MKESHDKAASSAAVAVPLATPNSAAEAAEPTLVADSSAVGASSRKRLTAKFIRKHKLVPNKTTAKRHAVDSEHLFDSSDDEPLLPPRKRISQDQPRPQERAVSDSLVIHEDYVYISSEIPSQIPVSNKDEATLIVPVKKRKFNYLSHGAPENILHETKIILGESDNICHSDKRCRVESDKADDVYSVDKVQDKSGPSTSLFNSTFNEVLAVDSQSPYNSYSDKTEPYEYNATSPNSSRGSSSFSPLPSTSRDFETFQKNDLLLQECLRADDDRNEDHVADEQVTNAYEKGIRDDDEVQIIEVPLETIVVDDNDDEVELVSYSNIPKYTPNVEDPMVNIDDILGSFGDNVDNSDCEIIDVDNVIAENNALLEKIKQKNEPLDLTRQVVPPLRQDSPMQLLDMDTSTITPSSFNGGTSSAAERNDSGETMSIIIEDFFKSNPPVASESSSSLNTICCTLSTILDHMSNILTETPNAVGTSDTRKGNKQHLNNYANNLMVTDTVDLDEVWRGQPQSDFAPAVDYFLHPRPVSVVQRPQKNIPVVENLPAPKTNPCVETTAGTRTSLDNNEKSSRPILECPICMEHLTSKPIASTICGHIFCMACIQKALKAPGGKKCPTCRHSFTKKGPNFHPLFL